MLYFTTVIQSDSMLCMNVKKSAGVRSKLESTDVASVRP